VARIVVDESVLESNLLVLTSGMYSAIIHEAVHHAHPIFCGFYINEQHLLNDGANG